MTKRQPNRTTNGKPFGDCFLEFDYFLWILFFGYCFLTTGCASLKAPKAETIIPVSQEPRQIVVEDISFDPVSGKIIYTLPEDGNVRIRIGLTKGGPLLTHLLDWAYRHQGRHSEEWDGRVGQSPADYRNREDLMITIFAYSAAIHEKDLGKFWHFGPAPAFDVLFPEANQGSGGYPVLKGKTPIRIEVPPETMRWLADLRYEIALYFDDLFIYEEEEGLNPYTYVIDTVKYNNGVHHINVNIICSSGQAGAVTKAVMINNP